MKIDLDTSAAVRILLDRDLNCIDLLMQAESVLAPTLYMSEIGNVFLKYHRIENLEYSVCLDLMDKAYHLITEFVDEKAFTKSAFDISIKYGLSYYDGLFLTLAIEKGAGLLTKDKKLHEVAAHLKIAL